MKLREQILAACKSKGFDGKETGEAVAAFCEENRISFTAANGDAVDIKAVFVTADTQEEFDNIQLVEPATTEESEADMDDDDADEKSAPKPTAKSVRGANRVESKGARVSVETPGAKRYEARVKSHGVGIGQRQAAFVSADRAAQFGAWFRNVAARSLGITYAAQKSDVEILTKAHSVADFTTGGALVPDDFRADIIELVERFGVMRRVANLTTMSRDSLAVPKKTSDITAYWLTENTAITESDAGTAQVQLDARKLAALTSVSNEFLNDSAINAGDFAARSIAQAFSKAEDQAAIIGDGSTTYGGVNGIINQLKNLGTNPEDAAGLNLAAGNAWEEITAKNIRETLGLVPHYDMPGEDVMLCSKPFYHSVLVPFMVSALGTGIADVQGSRFSGSNGEGPDAEYFGIPVFWSQVMEQSEINDGVPLLVGRFDLGVEMGEVRNGMNIAVSEHAGFASDQVKIRGTNRLAINFHEPGDTTDPGAVCGLILEDA